ncbi:MAG TPA: hypothetical protein PKY05_11305 [Fibrobacteria bacterium]|nr:hypothetical protein [Fibrobacteria bacterium]
MLTILMSSLLATSQVSLSAWNQEVSEMHRALHPRSMGYLDVAQIQSLAPDDAIQHPSLGRLEGFTQLRRVVAVLMGPDSSADSRLGLEGSIETGGWTSDLYLVSPPDLRRQTYSWSAGLAGSSVTWGLSGMVGLHHVSPTWWRGISGAREADGTTDFWGLLRWKRLGARSMVDLDGLVSLRAAYLTDPAPMRLQKAWFWPQVEGSLGWERADANPWSSEDALAGDLRFPVLDDRVGLRIDAGSDGFHFGQVTTNIDPQGLVGIDCTGGRRSGSWFPGLRLRMPVFTFSVNDPDEFAIHGLRGALVWSMRFQMTWEDGQTWYAPGRRPPPAEVVH